MMNSKRALIDLKFRILLEPFVKGHWISKCSSGLCGMICCQTNWSNVIRSRVSYIIFSINSNLKSERQALLCQVLLALFNRSLNLIFSQLQTERNGAEEWMPPIDEYTCGYVMKLFHSKVRFKENTFIKWFISVLRILHFWERHSDLVLIIVSLRTSKNQKEFKREKSRVLEGWIMEWNPVSDMSAIKSCNTVM